MPKTEAQGGTKVRNVAIVTASLLIVTLAANLQVPLYNTYAETAGYGSGVIAVTFAAYVVGLIPVLIMLGGVSDRIGRKKTMLLGLLVALFANVFIIVEPSMHMLINVRVLQGIAVGLVVGAGTAYVAEILKDVTQAASVTGIVTTMGLGSGSLITSASLAYHYSNAPYSYWGVAASTGTCVIMMMFMPSNPGVREKRVIRLPLVSKQTRKFCVAISIAWSLTGVIIATIPGELERLSLSGWSGVLVFLTICTGAVVQPWARRLGPNGSVATGHILLVLAYILLVAGVEWESLGVILVACACAGASSFGFIYLGGLAAVVRASEKEEARAVSGYFLFAYLGLGVPCIVTGYLVGEIGLLMALVSLGVGMGSAMSVLYVVKYVRSVYSTCRTIMPKRGLKR